MSKILKQFEFETPLGQMVVVADHERAYFVDFLERRNLAFMLQRLGDWAQQPFESGRTEITQLVTEEIQLYFTGKLHQFTAPLYIDGTPFQQRVWSILQSIPYGETYSYQAQAQKLQQPKAYRAVANANGVNRFAIIIPCHRVIRENGDLGGYGGGIHRKIWLLQHEQMYKK